MGYYMDRFMFIFSWLWDNNILLCLCNLYSLLEVKFCSFLDIKCCVNL